MKILIDCGAGDGAQIPYLQKKYGPFDSIYCFEANPEIVNTACDRSDQSIEVTNAAVWTENGSIKLLLGDRPGQSSVVPGKTTGNLRQSRSVEIPSIAFSSWVKEHVTPDDFVVCKMDIEGAEFDVIEQMISQKTIKNINVFLIEWHANRYPNKWELRFRRALIKFHFYLNGVKFLTWA